MQALYHFKISYLAPTLTSKGRKIYCLPICFHGTTLLTMYTAARTVIITVSLVIISYTHLILRIDLCTWISFLPDTNLSSDVAMSSNASFSESNNEGPELISVTIGLYVTLGVAKNAKISWTDLNGVSVGLTIDCPWHCPHMWTFWSKGNFH